MYMNSPENELSSQAGDSTNSLVEGYKVDGNDTKVSFLLTISLFMFLSSISVFHVHVRYKLWNMN